MKPEDTVPCPYCGEEIKQSALACPHCGSDTATGWSDKKYLDGIDLPEDDDYEEVRRNEFGDANGKKTTNRTWMVITGIVVLALFLLGMFSVLR